MIHTVKGFGIVSKAEIYVFLELSCFHDLADVGNLVSGSSAFSKTSLNIRKFTVHILLKPGLENFEHYFTSVWDECNCAVVWAFFGIAFLWDWNENWSLPLLWPLLSFPNLLTYWVQHFHSTPDWGSNLGPQHCECRVLVTGLSGKPPSLPVLSGRLLWTWCLRESDFLEPSLSWIYLTVFFFLSKTNNSKCAVKKICVYKNVLFEHIYIFIYFPSF